MIEYPILSYVHTSTASMGVHCPICFEEDIDQIGRLDTCTHMFCDTCILQWTQHGNTSCPCCRCQYNVITFSDNTMMCVSYVGLLRYATIQSRLYDTYKKYPYRVFNVMFHRFIVSVNHKNEVMYLLFAYLFISKWQLYQTDEPFHKNGTSVSQHICTNNMYKKGTCSLINWQ